MNNTQEAVGGGRDGLRLLPASSLLFSGEGNEGLHGECERRMVGIVRIPRAWEVVVSEKPFEPKKHPCRRLSLRQGNAGTGVAW